MTDYTPSSLADALRTGLLSFPVTHFTDDLSLDEHAYREHLSWLSQFAVSGLFVAGGTGEGFSLTTAEHARVLRAAVESTPGELPIIASVHGPTTVAVEQAREAERLGADGLLVFPPYLTEAPQEGLVARIEAIAQATSLGIIAYSRANGQLDADATAQLADRVPQFIGYKDGVGKVDRITRIYAQLGERLVYIGGLPTAETFALPYLELGASTYSSAIFNFVPTFALGFYRDVLRRDRDSVYRKLRDFVIPFTRLRDRRAGYAVALIKAGLDARGRRGGPVRTPLVAPTPEEIDELRGLIAAAAAE